MLFDRPKILIEEQNNDRKFFVEQYNKTLYLYITEPDYSQIHGIAWLANLTKAPNQPDMHSMNAGKPARMHLPYCTLPNGLNKVDTMRFEWNNDTLSVFSGNELLAIVHDCFGASPVAKCKYIKGNTRFGSEM